MNWFFCVTSSSSAPSLMIDPTPVSKNGDKVKIEKVKIEKGQKIPFVTKIFIPFFAAKLG